MELEETVLKRQRELAHKWVGATLLILAKHLRKFAEERYRAVYGERYKERMAEVLRQEGELEGHIDAARAMDLLLFRWKDLEV